MVPMKSSRSPRRFTCSRLHLLSNGFTVIELLVIILLLSLVIPLSFDALNKLSKIEKMKIAMAEAAGFLEATRQAAMSHTITCKVTISPIGLISTEESPANNAANRCQPSFMDSASLSIRTLSGDNSITTSSATLGFGKKGTAISNSDIEIIFSSTKPSLQGYQFCLLQTSPIGFVKVGRKMGTTPCKYHNW